MSSTQKPHPVDVACSEMAHGQTITQGEPPQWTTEQVRAIRAFAEWCEECEDCPMCASVMPRGSDVVGRFLAVLPAENAREGEEKTK